MEFPHTPNAPENPEDLTLADYIRAEVADYGGAPTFIRTHLEERLAPAEASDYTAHRANLLQMQRIARTVALPHEAGESETGMRHASAFYWGEVMAMEVGERIQSSEWQSVLYKGLSTFYRTSIELAHREEDDPQAALEGVGQVGSPSLRRSLVLADLMLRALEHYGEQTNDDDPFAILGRDMAAELADDDMTRHYAYLGYTLVMDIFADYGTHMIEEQEQNEVFAALSNALDNISEWSILESNDEA